MKKGMFSIDFIMALVIVSFVVFFIQEHTYRSLRHSEEFGRLEQLSSMTSSVASQLNAFYALSPEKGDFFNLLPPKISSFSRTQDCTVLKYASSLTLSCGDSSLSFPLCFDDVSYEVGEKAVEKV